MATYGDFCLSKNPHAITKAVPAGNVPHVRGGSLMSTPYTEVLKKDVEDLTIEDIKSIVEYERGMRVKFEDARNQVKPKKSKKDVLDETP